MLYVILAAMICGPTSITKEDIVLTGYVNGQPVKFDASWIPGRDINNNSLYLRADAAEAWKNMIATAAQEGIFLEATYAFREHKLQKQLKRKMPKLAATPGYSLHEAGLAVDIKNCTRKVKKKRIKTDTYRWLKEYGKNFGFYQTSHKEPWHWIYLDSNSILGHHERFYRISVRANSTLSTRPI